MRVMKSMGFVLVGLVVGVLATGSLSARQNVRRQTSESRLTFAKVEPDSKTSDLVFIKDTKTSGCWLAIDSPAGVTSLAAAPTEACTFK